MDQSNAVFDISSDEEETGGDDDVLLPKMEDYEWITELLGEDDVVVISEVTSNKQKLKLSNTVVDAAAAGDADDDDCVILDDDPDKPVAVVEDTSSRSDELLVVGEKGMVACRDYPHSRHLCAKFRFDITLHETHCDQCHCFVCDSLAPCPSWSTGDSYHDHCHATDKEDRWKSERKNVKTQKSGLPAVPNVLHTPQMMNPVPSLTHYNHQPRHQVSRPTVMRPCSSSTNYRPPNFTNQRLAPTFHKNRMPSRMGQPRLVRNNTIRKGRYQNMMNTSQRYVSSPSMHKRSASISESISPPYTPNPPYSQLHDVNLAYAAAHYNQNYIPAAIPFDKNLHPWQNLVTSVNFQPNMNGVFENSQYSQPTMLIQPVFEPILNQNIDHCQNQVLYPTDSRFSNSNCLVDNIAQTNEQPELQNNVTQSAELVNESSLVPDFNSRIQGTEDFPGSLYFDFEDWLMEKENKSYPTLPAQADASPDPSQFVPPESAAPIDPALLYFDFETSMHGLTNL